MKMESSSVKNPSIFKTAPRNNRREEAGRNTLLLFRDKFPGRYQTVVHTILSNLCVVIFTAALFLSGSYLFFTQLAEYGW
ncbi:hypothetical protein [Desulfopila inferna]|uniref:hypothetical protein n=1 Tax=Desulfopila inferna TaxID=468528 RepID=UPI00196306F0|nr:hypothetical protein [Desulfopila inferna]MBM9606358.1 hypothetical protein [Desulfopila inferna]